MMSSESTATPCLKKALPVVMLRLQRHCPPISCIAKLPVRHIPIIPTPLTPVDPDFSAKKANPMAIGLDRSLLINRNFSETHDSN